MLKITHLDPVTEANLFFDVLDWLNERGLPGKVVATQAELEGNAAGHKAPGPDMSRD